MSDSSNSEVSFKLFAYKGIDGWGLITEGEYKVSNIEVLLPEELEHGLLDIYLKEKRKGD